MPVVPELLPDTTAVPGYHNIDPITQWFRGGSGTAGAEATGINDDDRYGLDLLNVGSGGKSWRATSGNGLHSGKIDNSGATFTGGLAITGTAVFASPVVMQSTLSVTGPATFSTGVTVGGALGVTGASTLNGNVVMNGLLNVTGVATFASGVTCATLEVNEDASFDQDVSVDGNVDIDGTLDVDGDSNLQIVRLTPDPLAVPQLFFRATATRTYWAIGGSNSTLPNFQVFNDVTGVMTEQFEITETGRVNAKSLDVDGLSFFGDTVNVTAGGIEIDAGGLVVNGTATFHAAVAINADLEVDDIACQSIDMAAGGQITLSNGTIDFDLGDGNGFTEDTWGGYVTIRHDGVTKYVPYLSSPP